MTTHALAAMVALFALGANFIGTTLLLLFNPGSRSVRWYALFNASLMLWLALQGAALMTGQRLGSFPFFSVTIHMMPALFLAATVAQAERTARYPWLPLAPIVFGAALLLLPAVHEGLISGLWHATAWSSATLVYVWRAWRSGGRRIGRRGGTRGEKILEVILSAFVPIGVIGAILAQGGFVLFVLPLMTVMIQLLIFTGVVYHRYYDIEVRAARTGDLATAAAEQDRLALLGELSATIAHEVRNPLTGIRSLTQLIAEPELDDDKRVRYADVILGEVTRLDRIVGNLTDLARRSAGTGGALNGDTPLAPLFDDLMLLVESRARRSDVEVTAAHTDVVVRAPREALAQALLNLVLNAIAHAPPRSRVTLRAEHDSGGSTLSVSDRGPGVAPEERSRIFEPFHTRGGTGLGLTVVRRLAMEHGWTVGVADAEGGGAEFRIHIPAAAAMKGERS